MISAKPTHACHAYNTPLTSRLARVQAVLNQLRGTRHLLLLTAYETEI